MESRLQLEALTGRPVRFLAYPNGHYTESVRQAAEAAGYEAALAGEGSSVTPQSNLYSLPRFDVGAMPVHMLRLELSGMLGAARRVRSRLSEPARRGKPLNGMAQRQAENALDGAKKRQ